MDTKKEYTAPQLTVVTIKSERGYAASSDNPLAALQMLSNALTGLTGGNIETWDFQEDNTTFNDETINWQ